LYARTVAGHIKKGPGSGKPSEGGEMSFGVQLRNLKGTTKSTVILNWLQLLFAARCISCMCFQRNRAICMTSHLVLYSCSPSGFFPNHDNAMAQLIPIRYSAQQIALRLSSIVLLFGSAFVLYMEPQVSHNATGYLVRQSGGGASAGMRGEDRFLRSRRLTPAKGAAVEPSTGLSVDR
jgi:hypothetical protein